MGVSASSPKKNKRYNKNPSPYPVRSSNNTPIGESPINGYTGLLRGTNRVLNKTKARVSKPKLSPPKSTALKHLKEGDRPKRGRNGYDLRSNSKKKKKVKRKL